MRSVRIVFFLLFIFLCLHSVVYASDIKEYRLENGLKVLIIEEHKAPVATFQVWYRTGAKDEPAGKSGLSHLLEHMMFKGTTKYGPSVFSNTVQKNGGTDNAYTTKDYTVYFELFSSDRIALSIDLEADRMRNLLIRSKGIPFRATGGYGGDGDSAMRTIRKALSSKKLPLLPLKCILIGGP